MDIGVGLDATLNLSLDQQAELSQEAAQLGYTSVWTPESTGMDSFQLCAHRWAASRQVIPEGLHTGIAVSPVMYRTPVAFAMAGGTLSQLTGGRFRDRILCYADTIPADLWACPEFRLWR